VDRLAPPHNNGQVKHARGIVIAFGLFAASFALHIVGGATDQGWLFAIAVALIFITAVGFPTIAGLLARHGPHAAAITVSFLVGVALTSSALWAANGRSWAWWTVPAALALVVATNAAALGLRRLAPGRMGTAEA
jgi:hypothetical protein